MPQVLVPVVPVRRDNDERLVAEAMEIAWGNSKLAPTEEHLRALAIGSARNWQRAEQAEESLEELRAVLRDVSTGLRDAGRLDLLLRTVRQPLVAQT